MDMYLAVRWTNLSEQEKLRQQFRTEVFYKARQRTSIRGAGTIT